VKVLSVLNLKGGVGKTTTAVNVATTYAHAGHSVLLGDVDSQGDASSMLHENHEALPHSMADIFCGSDVLLADILQPSKEHDNLQLIPADERLNEYDVSQGYAASPLAHCLVDALSEIREQGIELCVLDCPPRPHLTSFASLVASDLALVPVLPSRFSLRSIRRLSHEVNDVRQELNPSLEIRFFMSMFNERSGIDRSCRDTLIEAVGEGMVLKTAVPRLATINTANIHSHSVIRHSPKSKAAQAFKDLVHEITGEEPSVQKQSKRAA